MSSIGKSNMTDPLFNFTPVRAEGNGAQRSAVEERTYQRGIVKETSL